MEYAVSKLDEPGHLPGDRRRDAESAAMLQAFPQWEGVVISLELVATSG